MARILYFILCCAAMACFVALLHWLFYGFGQQFGLGFGTGFLLAFLILGSWMWLNAKGHFDHL